MFEATIMLNTTNCKCLDVRPLAYNQLYRRERETEIRRSTIDECVRPGQQQRRQRLMAVWRVAVASFVTWTKLLNVEPG